MGNSWTYGFRWFSSSWSCRVLRKCTFASSQCCGPLGSQQNDAFFLVSGGLLARKGRLMRPETLCASGRPTRLRQTSVQPQPPLHIPTYGSRVCYPNTHTSWVLVNLDHQLSQQVTMQTDTLYLAVLACPRRKLTRDVDPVFIATYRFFPPWAAQRYQLSRISRSEGRFFICVYLQA